MKIGDYVRTKNQGIKRIDTIFKNATINKYGYEDKKNDYEYYIIRTDNIIKSSPDIIDVIEVGDYVNGIEIIDIQMKCDNNIKCFITKGYDITNQMIKSIVTKEQFSQIEYKIESEVN